MEHIWVWAGFGCKLIGFLFLVLGLYDKQKKFGRQGPVARKLGLEISGKADGWTVQSMVRSDLFDRAIPWTRLMLFGGGLSAELNLGWRHRLSAALTAVILLGLIVAPFVPVSLVVAAVSCLCFIVINREFLLVVRGSAGDKAAIVAIALHMLHYTSALAGFAWVFIFEYMPRRMLSAVSSRR